MIHDLEIWLIGTPAELDKAATALATTGRTVEHGTRRPLAGADTGRSRLYLRLAVAIRPSRPPQQPTRPRVAETLDPTA